MKYNYFEKKMEVSDSLKDYARKKIDKLDKYFKKEADAQVTFLQEGNRHIVEITVTSDGMFYRSKETSDEMRASIDTVVATIERQIHKNKTRLEKRLHSTAFAHAENSHSGEHVEEEKDFSVIKTKRFNIKPMTVEEAILQMNLLDHMFYVFRNFDNGNEFTVVYKRNDGGYGLIESE